MKELITQRKQGCDSGGKENTQIDKGYSFR